MSKFNVVFWAFLLVIPCSQAKANPDPPSAFAALSEVQIIDVNNWFVEVNLNKCFFTGASHWIQQGYTDSFVVVVDNSPTLAQFPCKKVMADTAHISKDGICVLSRWQFPSLFSSPLMLSGKFLHLTVVCGNQGECWTVPLQTLLPTLSIIGVQGTSCCGMAGPNGTCDMECPTVSYQVCNCPSIGSLNSSINFNCQVHVTDVNAKPVSGIRVVYSTNADFSGSLYVLTDSNGHIYTATVDSCEHLYFQFTDTTGKPVSTKKVGPIAPKSISTTPLEVVLNDYTSTLRPGKGSPAQSPSVRFIAALPGHGESWNFVFSLSNADFAGPIEVTVLSLTGKAVRTLSFNMQGKGTYTLDWNRRTTAGHRAAPGSYFCRIASGKTTLCAPFVIP